MADAGENTFSGASRVSVARASDGGPFRAVPDVSWVNHKVPTRHVCLCTLNMRPCPGKNNKAKSVGHRWAPR